MPKYINAKDLHRELEHFCYCEQYDIVLALLDVERIINEMPAADVVEVVKCKDCKHLVEIDDTSNLYVCDRVDIGMDGEPNFLKPEIDFCSHGER